MNSIPLVDLKAQYETIRDEVDLAIRSVLEKGDYIQGEAVKKFESGFANLIGANFCIGVGNGTDAITIALKALGIGAGDTVITAANSFIASAEAVTCAGAKPEFADCDPDDYVVTPRTLRDAIERLLSQGHRVRALIPVHLYGRACDMPGIMSLAREYDLNVIEDCAQAHCAKVAGQFVGTFGDAATFSFYPGKNLGAYGDAGAVVTQTEETALAARKYANHGRAAKYDHDLEGINSRLDTIQASVLNVKIPHIFAWTSHRQLVAHAYHSRLSGWNFDHDIHSPHYLHLPKLDPKDGHVFHLYVIRIQARDRILEHLKRNSIQAGVHYPIALPNLRAYSHLGHKPEDFPVASRYQNQILSLPMYPELTEAQIDRVTECLKNGPQRKRQLNVPRQKNLPGYSCA